MPITSSWMEESSSNMRKARRPRIRMFSPGISDEQRYSRKTCIARLRTLTPTSDKRSTIESIYMDATPASRTTCLPSISTMVARTIVPLSDNLLVSISRILSEVNNWGSASMTLASARTAAARTEIAESSRAPIIRQKSRSDCLASGNLCCKIRHRRIAIGRDSFVPDVAVLGSFITRLS